MSVALGDCTFKGHYDNDDRYLLYSKRLPGQHFTNTAVLTMNTKNTKSLELVKCITAGAHGILL